MLLIALPTAFRFAQDEAQQTRQDKLLARVVQLRTQEE